MQTTLKTGFSLYGVGLHTGKMTQLRVLPAAANTGIVFRRTDVSTHECIIPAHQDMVELSPLCTKLKNKRDVTISTVEHIMAALAGCHVDNALIEVDGPEIPILDGSSLPFVREIRASGIKQLNSLSKVLRILKPLRVSRGDSWAEILPGQGFSMEATIDFQDAAIGRQSFRYDAESHSFDTELAASRTFCRIQDLAEMRRAEKALGGSFDNAIVIDQDKILTPGGLRIEREFVRHKMLDAIGDLALVGSRIEGFYRSYKPGHALNNLLARAMMNNSKAVAVEFYNTHAAVAA